MALDFTIPGYDIELRVCLRNLLPMTQLTFYQPGGRDTLVTSANVHDYIDEVLDAILGKGIQAQAKAFREGFSKVFPIDDLRAFTAEELVMLFGNTDEDWSQDSSFFSPVIRLRSLLTSSPSSCRISQGRSWLQHGQPLHPMAP
jgi:HECT-domain (ubiquitin-transferase)